MKIHFWVSTPTDEVGSNKATDRNVMLEFLVGTGKKFYDDAVATLADRNDEMNNQAVVKDLLKRAEHVEGLQGSEFLDGYVSLAEGQLKVTGRKKSESPLTGEQLKVLDGAVKAVSKSAN